MQAMALVKRHLKLKHRQFTRIVGRPQNKSRCQSFKAMIENIISQIVTTLPPTSGANLGGFIEDLRYALWKNRDFLASAQVGLDPDPSRLVNVAVIVSDEVASLQDVKRSLLDVWRFTAHTYFQASSCVW